MTITSENKRNQYTITAAQVVFPYTFRILAKEHLLVIHTTAAGVETELELTTNYTVSGVGGVGGNVTTCGDDSPYPTGDTITIIRDVPLTQLIDYVENDMFPAQTHEKGLDKLTMIVQEMSEILDRMVLLKISSTHSGLVFPDPEASKFLAWKDDLSGLKNASIVSEGDLSVTDYIKTLLDDENASAALTTLGVSTFIKTLLDNVSAAVARATLGIPADYASPLSVPPAAFVPISFAFDWVISEDYVRNASALSLLSYVAPLHFPNGAVISKLTLHGFRDDAAAIMALYLFRGDKAGGHVTMGFIVADWTDGAGSVYDDSIDYATIDNENYTYMLKLALTPNDHVDDVKYYGGKIDFA